LFESISDVILQAVKKWVPKKQYSKHNGYRDDLYEFLRKKLKHREEENIFGLGSSEKYIARKEAGSARADIAVVNSEKIGIELKFNFRTKGQRNRLSGQIKDYFREYSYVIIVLCGYVDTQQLDALRYDFKEFEEPTGFSYGQQQVVKIISKSKTKASKKRNETKRKTRKKKEESIWDLEF